jgi:phosphatidylglycerol lysyltransferase
MRRQNLLHGFGAILGLVLFSVVLWVLHHELQKYHYHEIVRHVREIPDQRLALALLLTVLNYLVLTGHDALAFRYLRYPLSYSKIALASFLGYAFSHNIGFALLSSASMRYRLYSTWGLAAGEIATVVAFNGVTFWFGVLLLGGLTFVWEPLPLPPALQLPFFQSIHPLGVVFLCLVAAYLLFSAVRTMPLKIREWELPLPPFRLAVAQVVLSSLDWMLAASVLYVLLPASNSLSYPHFLGVFILAQIAGVSSQLPGGLGVFETVVLFFLSPLAPTAAILGALVVYRGMYYLLPLGVATVLLAIHELLQRQETLRKVADALGRWTPVLTPHIAALGTFISGAVLLFSGATPAVHSRLAWLNGFVPLVFIELSHFLGSVVGVGLLLLARGLQQRLDAAYLSTLILLTAGILFSLLKGFDYEEATILAIMLGAMWPCRPYFYRQSSLVGERFSPGWIAAIMVVLLGSIWLGRFSHKHVEYAHELWWQFALYGDAPRFLRAMVGALGGALIFAVTRLFRPVPPTPTAPDQAVLEQAQAVVARSRRSEANLALLGDKALLFNTSGDAFLMYGIEGRSWVALGDPIGVEREQEELAWRFRELCDRHGGWPVFYQVSQDLLPLYIDLGLTFLKLGEEARVDLETFSLKGDAGRKFRHTINHIEKADCAFSIVPAGEIPLLLPELRRVSDAWLAEKNTREKGFSLGCFTPQYLRRFPAGVIRQKGRIIAFANLWLGAEKEELSPDLMRHVPGAPSGIMDYLFLQLMLWGQQEGYRWFSLGMAPLSGLEDHALAPLWSRLGALVFRHGEHFYNFRGLRQYKEKFDPIWEPKYLASPGGLALPRILTNIASLISGGLKGVITK